MFGEGHGPRVRSVVWGVAASVAGFKAQKPMASQHPNEARLLQTNNSGMNVEIARAT
jgi:hypothetical protein